MKKILIFSFILIYTKLLIAQISEEGSPLGLNVNAQRIPTILMDKVDLSEIKVEDSLDALRNLPVRFGKAHDVNIDMTEMGEWTVNNSDFILRLKITCPEALSVNLIYSQFNLPEGSKFYVYSEDKSYILGAFTANNNKSDGSFASGLIPGESIILEYNSFGSKQIPIINIERVVHGYRDFFNLEKLYGDSGPCNNNVNCPEGLDWQDQTSSVAMIVLGGGTRWCTGAMINNTCNDGIPYFLTANHCLTGPVNNWMFYFNYESPICIDTADAPTNQIVTGAKLLATSSLSDFALLELDSRPPSTFSAFYSGWSRNNNVVDTSVAIHHPSGDIKKISFSYQPTHSTFYLANSQDSSRTHWKVVDWDDGTTEGGSSGSPLFNTDKQIIGQLHGGYAACSNNDPDWYGKIWYSWDKVNTPSTSLKSWLDPANTGKDTLNGKYFGVSPGLDLVLTEIISPSGIMCSFSQSPQLRISNKGTNSVSSFSVAWEVPGSVIDTFHWTGNMLSGQDVTVNLNSFSLIPGTYVFNAEIIDINGLVDFNTCNNTKAQDFEIVEGSELEIVLQTDSWASETSIEIVDSTGNQLYFLANFQDNTLHSYDLCLPIGCYDLIIYDSYGDGLTGQGFYEVSLNDSIIYDGSGTFGNCTGSLMANGCSVIHQICIDSANFNQSPVANFSVSSTNVEMGDTVFFIDQSFNAPNSWEWTVSSDDTTAVLNGQNPYFIGQEVGVYDVELKVSNNFGSDSILVESAFGIYIIGIESIFEDSEINIFPNPFNDKLNIVPLSEIGKYQVRIRTLEGKTVSFVESSGEKEIDLGNLINGIYILEVIHNDDIHIQKIVKE